VKTKVKRRVLKMSHNTHKWTTQALHLLRSFVQTLHLLPIKMSDTGKCVPLAGVSRFISFLATAYYLLYTMYAWIVSSQIQSGRIKLSIIDKEIHHGTAIVSTIGCSLHCCLFLRAREYSQFVNSGFMLFKYLNGSSYCHTIT
jgi:hypothetical protein